MFLYYKSIYEKWRKLLQSLQNIKIDKNEWVLSGIQTYNCVAFVIILPRKSIYFIIYQFI